MDGLGQAVGSIAGTIIGGQYSKNEGQKNRDMQYDFAKNGVSWKVQDAINAGVHPLYALGAQTNMASPSYVGDDDYSQMGQQIGQLSGQLLDAQIENIRADTQKKHAEASAAGQGNITGELANIKPEDVDKTLRGEAKRVASPGSYTGHLGTKSKPLYELNTVNDGKIYIMPAEGTIKQERGSESIISSHLESFNGMKYARQEAAERNAKDPNAYWIANTDSNGDVYIINLNNHYGQADFTDYLGGYYEKGLSKLRSFFK